MPQAGHVIAREVPVANGGVHIMKGALEGESGNYGSSGKRRSNAEISTKPYDSLGLPGACETKWRLGGEKV